jgi:hypothetical protein
LQYRPRDTDDETQPSPCCVTGAVSPPAPAGVLRWRRVCLCCIGSCVLSDLLGCRRCWIVVLCVVSRCRQRSTCRQERGPAAGSPGPTALGQHDVQVHYHIVASFPVWGLEAWRPSRPRSKAQGSTARARKVRVTGNQAQQQASEKRALLARPYHGGGLVTTLKSDAHVCARVCRNSDKRPAAWRETSWVP